MFEWLLSAGYIGGYIKSRTYQKIALLQMFRSNVDSVSGHHFLQAFLAIDRIARMLREHAAWSFSTGSPIRTLAGQGIAKAPFNPASLRDGGPLVCSPHEV